MATAYFSPHYFSPCYFSSLAVPPAADTPRTEGPPPPRSRDRDAYQAILKVVAATGGFDQVLFGYAGARARAGADRYPVAMVTPKGWEEVDDADPTTLVRRAKFSVTIVIRDEDAVRGFDELDRLSSLVEGGLDRSDLGGTVLAPLTKVRAGRFFRAANPEQAVELDGEFTSLYEIPTP